MGANPRAGTRKRSPRKLSGEGEALASEKKGRAFPGEGPACAKGVSLTLGCGSGQGPLLIAGEERGSLSVTF